MFCCCGHGVCPDDDNQGGGTPSFRMFFANGRKLLQRVWALPFPRKTGHSLLSLTERKYEPGKEL
jgi:hypothetical protein